MALTVAEVMNREIYAARPDEEATSVLRDLLNLGVGGGPVVDPEHRPVGVVSVRDLATAGQDAKVKDRMTTPPIVVGRNQSIQDAAVLMAETGYHRLVVVEDDKAVGIVSSLDIIRGLVGLPSRHPMSFPHYDSRTGAVWSDPEFLDLEHVEAAPMAPGVFIILDGGANRPERVVWGEASENVRQRLIDYLSNPAFRPSTMTSWWGGTNLRFKSARSQDPDDRLQLLKRALEAHTAAS